jgi:hypothetical protein
MAAAHVRIAAILEQIGQQHALIGARQLEAIDLLRQGRKERALELIGVLDELQALLQRERMQMQASASDMLASRPGPEATGAIGNSVGVTSSAVSGCI